MLSYGGNIQRINNDVTKREGFIFLTKDCIIRRGGDVAVYVATWSSEVEISPKDNQMEICVCESKCKYIYI